MKILKFIDYLHPNLKYIQTTDENHNIDVAMSSSSPADSDCGLTGGILTSLSPSQKSKPKVK